MLLAEALAERADAQRRLAQVQSRISGVARFQEGEEPEEDAAALVREALVISGHVEGLIRSINRTNSLAQIVLESGEMLSIADAIAMRDGLSRRRGIVSAAADAARGSDWERRSSRSELRMIAALPVSELRQQADALAAEFRRLDVRIQQANWSTQLVD